MEEQQMFNGRGIRCSLPKGFKGKVTSASREHRLSDYFASPDRDAMAAYLYNSRRVFSNLPTLQFFYEKILETEEVILENQAIAGLFNGPRLWLTFEKFKGLYSFYVGKKVIPGVVISYTYMGGDSEDKDHHRFLIKADGMSWGRRSLVQESGMEILLHRMEEGPVVGVFFPTCLQGFSMDASREQMLSLPRPKGGQLILADQLIYGAAWIGYPDTIGQDCMSPVSDCAASCIDGFSPSFFVKEKQEKGRYLNVGHYESSNDHERAYPDCGGGLLFLAD